MSTPDLPSGGYAVTPEAQRLRRLKLEPSAIRVDLLTGGHSPHERALGLIRMTGYLQCDDAERVQHVDRILDILTEVTRGRYS